MLNHMTLAARLPLNSVRNAASSVWRRRRPPCGAATLLCAIAVLWITACGDPTEPQPGRLRVATRTVGGDLDEDGYSLLVGAERRLAVRANGTVLLDSITAGSHALKLEGVADNCTVSSPPPHSITVLGAAIADFVFVVTCEATGIQVTTRTTGADRPEFGYLVKSGERTGTVATTGSTVVSRLTPGSHTVALTPAENCSVAGAGVATVNVSNRVVTPVLFEVACVRTEKRIAFVRDTAIVGKGLVRAIHTASATGSTVVYIAAGTGPAWSPDGTTLAFSNAQCDSYYGTCTGGIVLMDADTRTIRPSGNSGTGFDPSWSPDGKLIAISRISRLYGEPAALVLIDPTGSAIVELNTPFVDARNPSWSPDGRRIVFECGFVLLGGTREDEICIINRDGTEFLRLTRDASFDESPAWSPDGTLISFSTGRFNSGGTDIALMTPAGTDIRRLTRGFDAAWSPDGSRLVFSLPDGLFTIGRDGSDPTRLTRGSHRAAAWRP
ncbi:MAG: hypothetical protein WKF55_06710 [Gemmatimonadaceae bacterium]